MGLYGYPGLPPGYPPPPGMHGAPVPGMPPSAVPTSGFSAPDARRSRSRTAGDCFVSFQEIAGGQWPSGAPVLEGKAARRREIGGGAGAAVPEHERSMPRK